VVPPLLDLPKLIGPHWARLELRNTVLWLSLPVPERVPHFFFAMGQTLTVCIGRLGCKPAGQETQKSMALFARILWVAPGTPMCHCVVGASRLYSRKETDQ
jgi:hypothetical protein